jgi:ribosomal protein S6 kinase alpha-5
VRKRGGVDDGTLYAMKVMRKDTFVWGKELSGLAIERNMFKLIGDSQFMVTLHYAFQTDSNVYLIMGEYIKSYMHGCRILPD